MIVESLDRLSRQSPRYTIALLLRLLEARIEVHLLMTGHVFLPEKDEGMDLIFAVAIAIRAHEESEVQSKRLCEAWAKKREEARAGKILHHSIPWWLQKKDGKIVAVPERAKLVRRIFRLVADKRTPIEVARLLNEEKQPTWRPKAKKWIPAFIRAVIRRNAALGVVEQSPKTAKVGRRYKIEGYYPRIVSDVLVAKARAAIKRR